MTLGVASLVSNLPTEIGNSGEGWEWEGKEPGFKPLVIVLWTDDDMLKTFGANMYSGKFLGKEKNGVVINKTFADMIGWDSFTGKRLKNYGSETVILGVMNDIHFNSLADKTKPMAILFGGNWRLQNYLVLKINMDRVTGTFDFVRKTCKSIDPSNPAECAFLNDQYNKLLASEINLNKLVGIFSVFSVVVLCLGLLGVVMFLAEQKTKEIGIRKCMGENVLSVSIKFIKPFLISGAVAISIAMPLTWFAVERWLQNYAYRIHPKIWVFIISGLLTVGIAVVTIAWHTCQAATKNPVEALRYE